MSCAFHLWKKIAISGALGLLSACSLLPETPSRDNYRLPLSTLSASTHRPVSTPQSLRVATPRGGRLLDGLGILVIPQGNQINVYQGAQWSDPAPILVRNRLLDAFRLDERLQVINNDGASLIADFELRSELQRYQVEYRDQQPYVVIQLDAALVAPTLRRSVGNRSFLIELPAQGKAVPEIVQTFGAATDQLAQSIVAWAVQQANQGK